MNRLSSLSQLVLVASLPLSLCFIGCEAQEKTKTEAPKVVNAHKAKETAPSSTSKPAAVGKGEKASDRGQIDKDGVVRRGPKLASGDVLNIQQCTPALDGKSVKVKGTVAKVCAVKGCWFVIEDEKKQQIRITSKGYKFFIPKNAVGKKAVIAGDLMVKTMSVKEAQHMEDDAASATGKKAKKITEEKTELRIAAVSLELR